MRQTTETEEEIIMAFSGSVTIKLDQIGQNPVDIDLNYGKFSLPDTRTQTKTLKIWNPSGDAVPLKRFEVTGSKITVQFGGDDAYMMRIGADVTNADDGPGIEFSASITSGTISFDTDADRSAHDEISPGNNTANVNLPKAKA